MNSFYGGQQGKNFEIAKVFRNKVALAADLNLRWQSSIGIGELALIAYGRPNITEYAAQTGATPLFTGTDKELLKTKTFNRTDANLQYYIASTELLELGDYCKYDSSNYYLCVQQITSNDEVTQYVLEYHTDSPKYSDNVTIDNEAYGKTYNGSLWQKIYREPTESANTTELEGIETFFGSDQYGFGYKLITSICGNTPKIGIDTTEIIGPSVDPSVTLDSSNIDEPKFKFHIPRMIDFEYGTELSYEMSEYKITGKSAGWMALGDVYVNSSYGHIFTVTSITQNGSTYDYGFEYNGCMAGPVAAINTSINPYAEVEGVLTPVNLSVVRVDQGNNVSAYEFKIPATPLLSETVEWIGSTEEGVATLEPISTTTLGFDFKIPKGARYFIGDYTVAPDPEQGQLQGDYLIDKDTSKLYQATKSDSSLVWTYTNFALVGTGLKFLLNDNVDYETMTTQFLPYDLDNVVPYIRELMTAQGITAIEPNELVSLTWKNIPASTGADNGTYWYNCKHPEETTIEDQGWSAMLVAANISFLVKERTTTAQADNVAYTAKYINDLIVDGTIPEVNKPYKTYSAAVIEDLLSWGTF